ncbi:DUF6069 family protein [Paramicrobacterium agarici]|uniref:Uncharacterized protein n=1 Tax=Paramicrobacterium agarici TaxID=630514 RepID=A0A2A9DWK1_9MICO|nr:DUF6069 family protein [Microbacterium agarici]PFG30289.1 hypothetical protein ATJ78_1218 [Microbacterium agarici]
MTSTQKATRATQASQRTSTGARAFTSTLTIAIATLAALLIWAICVPLLGIELDVPQAGMTVGPIAIAVSALGGGIAAWGLQATMGRTRRGLKAWTVVALVVLALSLAGPALSGAIGAALSILEILHIVVGTILIVGLRRAGRAAPARRSNA